MDKVFERVGDRKSLWEWLPNAHPEIFKEWQAIRAIELMVEKRDQINDPFGSAPIKMEGSEVDYGTK